MCLLSMKLSHSKLNCILSNPAEYYLVYKEKIKPKLQKPALSLGSAVHYALENNSSDLSEYYNSKLNGVKEEEVVAEAMAEMFLSKKEEVLKDILDGCKVVEEYKEIKLSVLDKINGIDYEFEGIIDLLLLTDKGFVIIDYKTSSQHPDYSQYLDQIYRYIYLLRSNFPETPIYKTAIINIRKCMLRKRAKENDEEFFRRIKWEYENVSDDYLSRYVYKESEVNINLYESYINNLKSQWFFAYLTDQNNVKCINFKSADEYGGSSYRPIYYQQDGCENLYEIEDVFIDEDDNIVSKRDCVKLDMIKLFNDDQKVLNKYRMFKKIKEDYEEKISKKDNKNEFFKYLRSIYLTDNKLLETYWKVWEREKENGKDI